MFGEMAELAVGFVGKPIGVLPGRNEGVFVADVDFLAVLGAFDVVIGLFPVLVHGEEPKSHGDRAAGGTFVFRGEFPHQTMADGLARGPYPDGLIHGQRAVRGDGDPAVEGPDAFLAPGGLGGARKQEQDGQEQPGKAREAVHDGFPPGKATLGTARSAGFSSS